MVSESLGIPVESVHADALTAKTANPAKSFVPQGF